MNNKISSKIISTVLLCTTCVYTAPVFAYTKDETVYSKLDTNGKNYKTVVSTHIKNTEKAEVINDISNLLQIENTNGDEKFTQDGASLTWRANKNDIYYQGNSEKELPIDCNIRYELDGKEISDKEILGKSGKIKITIEYKNKDAHVVNVNGVQQTMYTPFVVVVGTIFEESKAKNITVSNGKVINDGTKSIVAGIALPGLKESLKIDNNDIEIPSRVEIEMEATEFESSNIISYVTPKVFEKDDLKIFDKMDEMYSKVQTLQESSKKIESGANKLADGTKSLDEGAINLNQGAQALANGTEELSVGTKQLAENMPAITNGAKQLASGQQQITGGLYQIKAKLPTEEQNEENENKLNYVKNNNETAIKSLNSANKQIEGQITEIQTKKQEAENKKIAIQGKMQEVNENYEKAVIAYNQYNGQLLQINNGINAVETQINETEDDKTKTALETKLAELQGQKTQLATIVPLLKNQMDALKGTLDALNGTIMAIEGTISLLNNTQESLGTSNIANTNLSKLISGNNQVVDSSINTISSMRTLSGAVNQLSNGSEKLFNGATQLQNGSSQIEEGTKQVNNGAGQLNQGAHILSEGTKALKSGTIELNNGAQELADGIRRFNTEGIEKICNIINGDVKDRSTRVKKLAELSQKYNNFSMINEGNEGEVKFIMIIDAIKKQEENEYNKEKAIINKH